MNVTALTIPVSPPASPRPKIKLLDPEHIGLLPIELMNGCSEVGCSIESDNPILTNVVRKHFLEHFGHRDLDAMVEDYAANAIVVNVINGERKSYHGKEEIRECLKEIFALHPTVNSAFNLKHIVIHGADRYGMAVWTALTPTRVFPQSSDTFLFDDKGKITKQFFNCQVNRIETPWYVEE